MSTTPQALETMTQDQENYTFAYLDDSIDQLELFETYSKIGIDSNHEVHLYNPHQQQGNIKGGIEELLENANQYDAIVLDWDLKMDTDGLEIAQELRQEYQKPIILYSNTREEKMLEKHKQANDQVADHNSVEETLENFKFNQKDVAELTKTLNQL